MAKPVAIPTHFNSHAPCNLNADESTPPEQHNFPLTPPSTEERQPSDALAVEHILRIFNDLHNSRPSISGSSAIKLRPDQYLKLLSRLKDDQLLQNYVDDKVRWDYNPATGQFHVRMPSPVHDFFVASIAGEISNQLQTIINKGGAAREFAALIANGGSSRILLRADNLEDGRSVDSNACLQRRPDAQFQHYQAAYPGVVLEVSYSQNGKDLEKLAWDYIMHSNGNIKVVIGIDVEYDGKESTLSLWRPFYVREEGEELDILEVEQVIKSEIFRTRNGLPANQHGGIRLHLTDFGPDEISNGYETETVEIRNELLATLLNRAEQMHLARESPAAFRGIVSKRRIRKRKLPSSSPAEDLRSDDEAEHRRREALAEERAAVSDDDFELPSSRRRKVTSTY